MKQLSFDSNCIVQKYIYNDHAFHLAIYRLNFMNAYCQISPFWTFDSFNFLNNLNVQVYLSKSMNLLFKDYVTPAA